MLVMILSLLPFATSDAAASEEFLRAQAGYTYQFPADHGSHPAYGIEWWYITGHLFEANGRRYGFQATFFRRGIVPRQEKGVLFGKDQLYMAHMAILDLDADRFLSEDRINRNGWDADAAVGKLDIHNGNWTLTMVDEATETMTLAGTVAGEYAFALNLIPRKSRVIFGENGVSVKGEDAASLYITFPRLSITGSLTDEDGERVVTGSAWMDHEISTSQLTEEQVGWDWASIQLDDQREIMLYLLRHADGSLSPYSKLTWIDQSGRLTSMDADSFSWKNRATWTSTSTGITYPVDFDLVVPQPDGGAPLRLRLQPLREDQEFVGRLTDIHYWEGACHVRDLAGRIIGRAFIELTGYGDSLQGKF